MANILSQRYIHYSNQFLLGVHEVKLTAAADTITVPTLADTGSVSAKQLERSGDPTVTVTTTGSFTVNLAGTIGDEVIIVTIHAGNRNQLDEA